MNSRSPLSRALSLMVGGLLASGCSTPQTVETSSVVIDQPIIGQIANVQPGTTILEKSDFRLADALISETTFTWTQGLFPIRLKFPAGILLPEKRDSKYTYFHSAKAAIVESGGKEIPFPQAQFPVPNENLAGPFGTVVPTDSKLQLDTRPVLRKAQLRLFDASGFRKELVYRGRSGDLMQFQYHSDFGDPSRTATNQNFEWNINDGRIVTISGARIEILDLTGSQMSYRVLKSFPDERAD